MTEILATDSTVAKNDSSLDDERAHRAVGAHHDDRSPDEGPDPGATASTTRPRKAFNLRLAMSRAIDREELVDRSCTTACTRRRLLAREGTQGLPGQRDRSRARSATTRRRRRRRWPTPATRTAPDFPTFTLTYRDNQQRRNEFDFLSKAWKDTLGINIDGCSSSTARRARRRSTPRRSSCSTAAGSSTTRTPRTRSSVSSTPAAATTSTTAPTRTSTRRSRRRRTRRVEDARIKAYQKVETADRQQPVRHHPDVPGRAAVPREREDWRRASPTARSMRACRATTAAECWYVKKS